MDDEVDPFGVGDADFEQCGGTARANKHRQVFEIEDLHRVHVPSYLDMTGGLKQLRVVGVSGCDRGAVPSVPRWSRTTTHRSG